MGNRGSSLLQDEEIKLISEETGFSPAQIERLYSRFTSLDQSGICGSLSRQDFLRVPELAINPLRDRIVHMFFVDCDDDHDRINFRQFIKVLATFRSSDKPTRSRNISRNQSVKNIFGSVTQNEYSYSRHSSCDDFSNYYSVHHHTTNNHSIYYEADQLKKPLNQNLPLMDTEEPLNSRKQKLFFMFKIYDVDNDNRISLDDLKEILNMMVGSYIDETKLTDLAVRTLTQVDKDCNGYIDFDEFCTVFLHRDIDEILRGERSTNIASETSASLAIPTDR